MIDLLGRGWIAVNGQPVRCVRLGRGDLLEVGPYLIRLRGELSPDRARGLSSGSVEALPDVALRADSPTSSPEAGGGPTVNPMSPFLGMLPARESEAGTLPLQGPPWGQLMGQPSGSPPPLKGDLVDSSPADLTNQFGRMQQQMFDQFQQVLMMMAQMFSNLHRDQMAQVREELDQLRKLNQDLHALQVQAERPPPAPAASPPAVPATVDANTSEALHRIEALLLATGLHRAGATSEGGSAGPTATAPNPGSPPSIPTTNIVAYETIGRVTQAKVARTSAEPTAGPEPIPGDDPPPSLPGNPPDDNIHALLFRRIATLQTERQGRWQKLLDMIAGH